MKKSKVEYVGKDLEAMDFAVNYHRWILDLLKPFLGKHLVEVGAGTGSFSELLLETNPETLALIEPSEMFAVLKENQKIKNPTTEIIFFQNIFTDIAEKMKAIQQPDTIIYINVLEHIEDDLLELETVRQTLTQKGRVCIFVPALPALYSEFDKNIGHFRRYRKNDLLKKCEKTGFKIVLSRNFDFLGILPWLIKYRLLKSTKMESGAVKLYDDVAVPVIRRLERFLPPPTGKNLLIVAEKI